MFSSFYGPGGVCVCVCLRVLHPPARLPLLLNLLFHDHWLIIQMLPVFFTRVKCDFHIKSLIMSFSIPFFMLCHFICTFLSVCTKCWCWSFVFSALGFFSYCLPALFGSTSSQPVCSCLSMLMANVLFFEVIVCKLCSSVFPAPQCSVIFSIFCDI